MRQIVIISMICGYYEAQGLWMIVSPDWTHIMFGFLEQQKH